MALKHPNINGEGTLIRAKEENDKFKVKEEGDSPVDFRLMGAGVLLICTFFVFGGLLEKVVDIPGPVMMILAAVLFKYIRALPERLEKRLPYILQIGVVSFHLACDDWLGHALRTARQRGKSLFNWLRHGLPGSSGCDDRSGFSDRKSHENVPHRVGNCHLLPQRFGRHR